MGNLQWPFRGRISLYFFLRGNRVWNSINVCIPSISNRTNLTANSLSQRPYTESERGPTPMKWCPSTLFNFHSQHDFLLWYISVWWIYKNIELKAKESSLLGAHIPITFAFYINSNEMLFFGKKNWNNSRVKDSLLHCWYAAHWCVNECIFFATALCCCIQIGPMSDCKWMQIHLKV